MKYRICPSCGKKNPEDEVLCLGCMTDLSGVEIIDEENIEKQTETEDKNFSDKTRVEVRERLIFKHEKFSIELFAGDIIGRHEKGREYLKDYPTVSRKHAKIYKESTGWYIEDLNSANGTYVNGKRINSKTKINNGDKISLSSSVSFVCITFQLDAKYDLDCRL